MVDTSVCDLSPNSRLDIVDFLIFRFYDLLGPPRLRNLCNMSIPGVGERLGSKLTPKPGCRGKGV